MTQPPQLAYTQNRSSDMGVKNKIASALLWSGAAFFVLLVLCGGVAMFLPPVFIGAGAVILLLLFISINAMVRNLRLRRAHATLAYIEQATRLNLPLSTLIVSAARSEPGLLGERLALLAHCLQNGFTVASALGRAVPEVPAEIIGEIAAGETAGLLVPTLRRLLEERRRRFSAGADEAIFGLFYPIFILVILGIVLFYFLLRVLPKFEEIFRDFRVALPRPTEILLGLVGDTTLWMSSFAMLLLFLVFVALLGGMLRRMFIARELPGLTRPVFDWLRWHLPLVGPILREAEIARVCRFLGEGIAQGIPMADCLQTAERIPQFTAMRVLIARWRMALLQGASIASAAAAAGLPYQMVELLRPAEFSSSVGEALAFLARYYRWRVDRRKVLLVAALRPAIVIAVGCLVGFIVVALFEPLVALIDANAGWAGAL